MPKLTNVQLAKMFENSTATKFHAGDIQIRQMIQHIPPANYMFRQYPKTELNNKPLEERRFEALRAMEDAFCALLESIRDPQAEHERIASNWATAAKLASDGGPAERLKEGQSPLEMFTTYMPQIWLSPQILGTYQIAEHEGVTATQLFFRVSQTLIVSIRSCDPNCSKLWFALHFSPATGAGKDEKRAESNNNNLIVERCIMEAIFFNGLLGEFSDGTTNPPRLRTLGGALAEKINRMLDTAALELHNRAMTEQVMAGMIPPDTKTQLLEMLAGINRQKPNQPSQN